MKKNTIQMYKNIEKCYNNDVYFVYWKYTSAALLDNIVYVQMAVP